MLRSFISICLFLSMYMGIAQAQTCSNYRFRSDCIRFTNCGWCESGYNRCIEGTPSSPRFESCSCGQWYTYQGRSSACAASRAWVTAVWVTILIVVIACVVAGYIRHRRRQAFYQAQAANNQTQATIITTQAAYGGGGGAGSPVMASVAQPMMATVASPVMGQAVMAQPVYATGGEGQPQYMQQGQPQGQPQYVQQGYVQQGQPQYYSPQPVMMSPQGQPQYYSAPPPGYQPAYIPGNEGLIPVQQQQQPQGQFVPAYGGTPAQGAAPVNQYPDVVKPQQ